MFNINLNNTIPTTTCLLELNSNTRLYNILTPLTSLFKVVDTIIR